MGSTPRHSCLVRAKLPDAMLICCLDGELMSVKWKIYKAIFRYSTGLEQPVVQPQFPMMYDLSGDPGEHVNLFATKLDNSWLIAPIGREIYKYEMSVKQYPNIKPGEEFKGYPH